MGKINAKPRLSFTALCRYLKASTPTTQLRILREQKFPAEGPMKAYLDASHRLVGHLVDGEALSHGGLRGFEAEAIKELRANWSAPAGRIYERPAPKQPKLFINDVEISCFPTVLVERESNGKRGAMKVFFNKEPKLDGDLGKTMATLLYHYLDEVVGSPVDPALVTILESRTGSEHRASTSKARLLRNVEDACLMVGSVWSRL